MTNHQSWRQRQAQRALERQLDYQQKKAVAVAGREPDVMAAMKQSSERVRTLLENYQPIDADASVIEVGSGAHGLIFFFGSEKAIGLDPLAVDYRRLFPTWQKRVPTVAAFGEQLPFSDKRFDIVLCDNVVDHAENPAGIVQELIRILKPRGLLYLTVNIHHAVYFIASSAHLTLLSVLA